MASPDGQGDHLRAEPGLLKRAADATLRWLPPALCLVVLVAAVALAVGDDPPRRSEATDTSDTAAEVPVLSLRRWPEPMARAAADQRLEDDLTAFVEQQPAETCLTVRVGDFEFDHRGDDPQTPASIHKLLTAVAVLSELGDDTAFSTEVRAPEPGADGTVAGNLHLVGGGDPLLATAPYMARERNQPQLFTSLEVLADDIVSAGVTAVAGGVVGDDRRFDAVRYLPQWPDRFVNQGVVGPISALSVNDGFAYLPDSGDLFFAADDPPAYAATALQRLLEERGVTFGGVPTSGPAPDLPVVASATSPSMVDVVGQMLAESDNNTAEILLKELGRRRTGEGTFAAGGDAVVDILADLELTGDTAVVADGSGLAPDDVVTCELVTDLLDHEPTADDIRSGLAVSGRTGTLSRRWLDTPLVGKVRAKTGTLNQVTSLAGLAETGTDDEARFALIVNLPPDEFISGELIGQQQQLAEILTSYPEVADPGAIAP